VTPVARAAGRGVETNEAETGGELDVLIVSLGSTGGLRAVDEELLASVRRAGASATIVAPDPPRPVRTLMLTDLRWARATRRAVTAELKRTRPRALIYSTTTAALLWPRAGAIRFDAPAAGNRRGRHGLWQRPLERRRLRHSPLLLPQSEGALDELSAGIRRADALVLPVPVEPSGAPSSVRDIAAIAYAANPAKKGLDRILAAWRNAREADEELVVAGVSEGELRRLGYRLPVAGVRVVGMLGGVLVGMTTLGLTFGGYLSETHKALHSWDVFSGVIKSIIFGLAIALISCQQGFATTGGAEGVGRRTTASVVSILFTLILLDAGFTMFFHAFNL